MENTLILMLVIPLVMKLLERAFDRIFTVSMYDIRKYTTLRKASNLRLTYSKHLTFSGHWSISNEDKDINEYICSILHYINTRSLGVKDAVFSCYRSLDRNREKISAIMPTSLIEIDNVKLLINKSTQTVQNKQLNNIKDTITVNIYADKMENIKEFVDKCYAYYQKTTLDDIMNNSYFFTPVVVDKSISYYQLPFNVKKSFQDLYFDEKNHVIEYLNKLRNGSISKFGLLLYGEPGCGKSSLIKAICNYLSYSVVEVKLSLITNDTELRRVIHSPEITVIESGVNKVIQLPLNRRIYVFEDIDADSTIVHHRVNVEKKKKSELSNAISTLAETLDKKDDSDKEEKKNSLSLSGILNALDGIIEMNGSVIIMTTNHVEKLDPALIRHGRVSMQIEMSNLTNSNLNQMIQKKFPDAKNKVYQPINPAKAEAMIEMASTLDELDNILGV